MADEGQGSAIGILVTGACYILVVPETIVSFTSRLTADYNRAQPFQRKRIDITATVFLVSEFCSHNLVVSIKMYGLGPSESE